MHSFLFLVGEFFHSLRQNRFLHFTYAVQVTISLLVLGIFFVLLIGAAAWWTKLGSYMRVHVFLTEGLSAQQALQMEDRLTDLDHVTAVEYRSKEVALELFREQNPDWKAETMDVNPLPASFIVSVDHPRNIEGVVAKIEVMVEVELLRYGKDVLQSYLKVLLILIAVCIVTITLLIMFTSSSISNIIGMTIYARRLEIRIMQLVGATWWFIRWPFLFEGVFFGFIGATCALLIILIVLAMMAEAMKLSNLMLAIPSVEMNTGILMIWLFVIMVGIGTTVGFFGSLKTINSFLRKDGKTGLDHIRV